MDALPPPIAPAAPAQPGCLNELTKADAQAVLAGARSAFPRTEFVAAWPSCINNLVALRMGNGQVAYTDKSARYLVLGLILDSATGQALDRQLDGRTE